MEKRVNLFMQGMVLFISLLLSVLIAVSITTQREDENRELLEDIRLHQQAPDSSYQRLRRGPVEKPELYDTVILQENGEQVQYSLPKENFLYTYLSVLPITIMVMGVFVLSIPTVAKRFTTNTLDPVIDTMEEVRGILPGRSISCCPSCILISCRQNISASCSQNTSIKPFFITARRPFTFHDMSFIHSPC
jgi:hypothetical protein